MNPILRNVLVVILGLVVGGIINAGFITFGHSIVPAPEGVNPNDIESIKANVGLYAPKHFLVPFLAHALGVLSGAYLVARLAASHYKTLAFIIGGFFFLGGISMLVLLPEFWKFSMIDLIFAYFPMAYLGWKLAKSPV